MTIQPGAGVAKYPKLKDPLTIKTSQVKAGKNYAVATSGTFDAGPAALQTPTEGFTQVRSGEPRRYRTESTGGHLQEVNLLPDNGCLTFVKPGHRYPLSVVILNR